MNAVYRVPRLTRGTAYRVQRGVPRPATAWGRGPDRGKPSLLRQDKYPLLRQYSFLLLRQDMSGRCRLKENPALSEYRTSAFSHQLPVKQKISVLTQHIRGLKCCHITTSGLSGLKGAHPRILELVLGIPNQPRSACPVRMIRIKSHQSPR